jgi:hypothetical protein
VMFGVHALVSETTWFVDVAGSAAAGLLAYTLALATVGLPSSERDRIWRIGRSMLDRRPARGARP